MSLRLTRDTAVSATPGQHPSDAVGQWLGAVSRLVRLDEAARRGICEELESHIRDRVRDLMVEGMSEQESIRRALDELGSAAELARRFEQKRTDPRRTLMHTTLFVVAGSALAISIGALTGGRGFTPGANPQPAGRAVATPAQSSVPAGTVAPPVVSPNAEFAGIRVTVTTVQQPLREVIESLLKQAGKATYANWDALEEAGHDLKMPVSIKVNDTPLDAALRYLNIAIKAKGTSAIAFRLIDGVVEVGTQANFDRSDAVLVCYDVTDVTGRVGPNAIVEAIHELVEPELWRENGGDIASSRVVGDRLFVVAPPRMQERVTWILGRLQSAGQVDLAPATERGGVGLAAP